jgi:hypothetical protein
LGNETRLYSSVSSDLIREIRNVLRPNFFDDVSRLEVIEKFFEKQLVFLLLLCLQKRRWPEPRIS